MNEAETALQILTLHTLVAALIETHPEPERLLASINQFEGHHLMASLAHGHDSAQHKALAESLDRTRAVIRALVAARSSPPTPG